jgi:hypothetical protein
MSVALKLGIESERTMRLVSPPIIPPRKPDVPRLGPIPRVDPPDSIPVEASDREILRGMANKMNVVYQDHAGLQGEIRKTNAKLDRTIGKVDDIQEDVHGLKEIATEHRNQLAEHKGRIEELEQLPHARAPYPSVHDLDDEWDDKTDGGTRRIKQEKWARVQRTLNDLRTKIDADEQEKALHAAELKGAQDFANRQKQIADDQKKRFAFWVKLLGSLIPIVGAVGGAVAWALHR